MGILGFQGRRRQIKEIEREVSFKKGVSRVRSYIQKYQPEAGLSLRGPLHELAGDGGGDRAGAAAGGGIGQRAK